jgi:hypothetical protein
VATKVGKKRRKGRMGEVDQWVLGYNWTKIFWCALHSRAIINNSNVLYISKSDIKEF